MKKIYHQFACSCLMLPEHRARLAQRSRENAGGVCCERAACADEQQLEQFQRLLEQSMHSGLPVKVTFVENGDYRTFVGSVPKQLPDRGKLHLRSGEQVRTIPIAAIARLESAPRRD